MTERNGTPLPWGDEKIGADPRGYAIVGRLDGSVTSDLPTYGADNPLDQLCDALHIRRPKGVERVRAMDAVASLIGQHVGRGRNGDFLTGDGIDRTLPAGISFPSQSPDIPSGHVGG